MNTLYLKYSQEPLPPLGTGDHILLLGDALYQSWPVPAWGLLEDAQLRGLTPARVELIDYKEWVRRLGNFDRCITC